jgi:hypothetical protein
MRDLAVVLALGLVGCVCQAPAPKEGGFREVVREKNYLVEFGPYAVEVDPNEGARIVAFSLDGRSVVVPRLESPEAYGTSFWPSPQRDWQWPPPVELDRRPWRVTGAGASLDLESETAPSLGISVAERITPDQAHGGVTLEYRITNRGTAPRGVAPWQNARVRPRGITFFPAADPSLPESSLKLAPEGGIIWFAHDPAAITEDKKLWADGQEGWMAQVDGDLLFVKAFADVPRAAQAPTEAEIVIYVSGSGVFVEMENQGAYESIAPGASSSWTVHWVLRRLPPGVRAEKGNPKLVELAREMAQSVR